jgi:hypothetical protein
VVSSTKLQFKDREIPTWLWILDVVGCSFALLRRVCWPTLEECYGKRAYKILEIMSIQGYKMWATVIQGHVRLKIIIKVKAKNKIK